MQRRFLGALLTGCVVACAEAPACPAPAGVAAPGPPLVREVVKVVEGEEYRPLGAPCGSSEQCASGRCTAVTHGCGICVLEKIPGETCGEPLEGCSARSKCVAGICKSSESGVGGRCYHEVSMEEGAYDVGCDDSLQCAGGTIGVPGKCQRRVPVGHACDTATAYATCVAGADCIRSVCVPKRIARLGEVCGHRSERCAFGLLCSYASGTCEVDPNPITNVAKEGEGCGWRGGICAPGLDCRGGRCGPACR
jgi:hypothetical protein